MRRREVRVALLVDSVPTTELMRIAHRSPRCIVALDLCRRASVVVLLVVGFFGQSATSIPRVRPLPSGWPIPLPTAFENLADAGIPAFRRFTSRDGLPQNAILAVESDASGLVWVGTKDGAAVYDGRTWTVVSMPPECNSNYVTCILTAIPGEVWFGTGSGGVARRSTDGTWRTYGESDGLPSLRISALSRIALPDGSDTVAVGTEGGLCVLSGDQWSIPELPEALRGRPCVALGSFRLQGGEPEFWASIAGTPIRRRGETWHIADAGLETGTEPSHVGGFAETSAIDGTPTIVAGHSEGVSTFTGDRWVPLSLPSGADYFNVGLFNVTKCVESINTDGTPSLWVAATGGLFRFASGQWTRFGTAEGFPLQPQSLVVTGDKRASHALWIGTNGIGLHRLQFGLWSAFRDDRPDKVFSIYSIAVTTRPDQSDVAWFGTVSSGVLRLEDGRRTYPLAGTRYAATWVRCLLPDPHEGPETMWLGCGDGSVLRVRNGRVDEVVAVPRSVNANVNAMHWSTFPDGVERLWLVTTIGIRLLEREKLVELPPGLVLADERATSILETTEPDGSRVFWIGTESGLVRYDGVNTSIRTTADGLPSPSIMSLREIRSATGERELWIGTRGGAARLSLDDTSKPMVALTTSTRPALPNNTVYRIESDLAGRLYLFTNKGIARLTASADPLADPSIYVFTSEDGLPSDECNTGASTVDSKGRVWVGTLEGAAVFDPSREIATRADRPIQVLSQSVVADGGRNLVPGESLDHDANHVAFEFAMFNHHREGSTEYRTQLVGYDVNPSPWSRDFRREYISLPAGTYVFRVWGRDVFGNFTDPVNIPFSVRSAPWLAWWAWLIYVGLLAALVVGIVRFRHRALRRHNDLLEQAIAERTVELGQKVEELHQSRRVAIESEHRAQEANLAKSVFLANMSHELRTPLNAVLGFSQLLDRSSVLGDAERHQLSVIRRSGEHLLGLINDVLSISKIEAGRLDLNVHAFLIADALAGIEAMTRIRAEAKGLLLEFQVSENFPAVVRGDDGKLRQVLLNLLGNAVKFTDSGVVKLTAEWTDGRASFVVSDTGCGIDPLEHGKLFEAFSQTESGRATQEGTGLGLTISRQIVRLMGGDIVVTSTTGAGAAFAFEVDLPRSDEVITVRRRRRVIEISETERRRRVLVVDDNAENRLLLSTLLGSVGFEVREAGNGLEAVEAALDWSPRVIFMDMRMPVMDGTEATREIRRLEDAAGRTRSVIIVTTASVFEQDRERILSIGVDDLVTKPFSEDEIFDTLARHASIQFVLADGDANEAPLPPMQGIELTGFDRIPSHIRTELVNALRVGDANEAERVAAAIARFDPALHAALVRRLRAFELEIVQAAVEAETSGLDALRKG